MFGQESAQGPGESHHQQQQQQLQLLPRQQQQQQQQQHSFSTSSSVTAASPLCRVQRQLECGVCLELLTDPRLLPCQHTFCHGCLLRLIELAVPDAAAAAPIVQCPVCRRVHPVQRPIASGFPRNLLAGSLLDSLAQCCLCEADNLASNACPSCGRRLCQPHFVQHFSAFNGASACRPPTGQFNNFSQPSSLFNLLSEIDVECRRLTLTGGGVSGSLIVDASHQQLVAGCAQQLLSLLAGDNQYRLAVGVSAFGISASGQPLQQQQHQQQLGFRQKDWHAVRQFGPSQPLIHACHSDPYDVVFVRHTQILYYFPATVCSHIRRQRPDNGWRRLPKTLLYCSLDNGELEVIACSSMSSSASHHYPAFSPLTRVRLRHRQRLALHYYERAELLLLANWQHSRVHVCNLALEAVHDITGLLHPRGLCVDPIRDLLYVTNSCVPNLDVYRCGDADYEHRQTLRHAEFRDPHSVCCHDDRLFVSDTGANSIFVFSAADLGLSRLLQRYHLDSPGFICIDWEGFLYAASGHGQQTVAVIDTKAQQRDEKLPLLAKLGCEKSSEIGRFRMVRGVASLDQWNCLCVCDFGNRRLQFFYF